jgi:protein-glutamine gamma-glutamyltransferase
VIPAWQIHRHALIWLFAAFSSVILIHAEHLPLWILLAAIFSMIWQVQRYRGVWPIPGRMVKYGLLALCLAGLFLEYGKSVSLEPMVALLVSTFTLKLLEMEHRRDALLVVFLAFFVAALQALFDQSIDNSVYILSCLLLVIAALVGLHQGVPDGGEGSSQPLRPLRTSVVLLLQAIPLMLLFFLIMPRLGSFWSVPIQSHSAKTGMSDKMSPGNFSRLGRSADVAFRVGFEGGIPRQHQLYWRGLILSDFDGRTWSRTDSSAYEPSISRPSILEHSNLLQWFGKKEQYWDALIERNGQPTEYSVILEPTQQAWLYSLPTPLPKSHGVALTRDFRLLSSQPITRKTQYDVHSWLDYRVAAQGLPSLQRATTLQLPQGYNPRSLALARGWRKNISDDLKIVQQALSLYNHEFTYTLSPPLLGTHSVDEFLFNTKRGFCEHFSSSFTFLMRAAGIPARVVAGYQGGERHPDNYLVVRQQDAHAWTEVWIKDKGWIRVDPTAAVAPERIEFDLESALSKDDSYLADSPLSLMQFRHINWLNKIRLRLDSLNYQWARWVLGYDNIQENLLKKWLGEYSPLRVALVLLIIGGSFLSVFALWQLRHIFKSEHDELDRVFLGLCKKLEKAGIPRNPGEGPRDYALRVAELKPEWGREVKAINSAYEHMRYGSESQGRLKVLKRAIKRLK